MKAIMEVAPGVLIADNLVRICPGCGLAGLPTPREVTPDNVRAWCRGAVAALGDMGVKGCSPEAAEVIAEAYITSPWHSSSQAHNGGVSYEG